ncbi:MULTISPECIES: hypothetical protein [Bacillus]|uniref:Uncharacterized protein n=1 Tax=Bacillus cereus TaxID=1396 RepID=A0A9X6Z7M4_BACCE|nr:hypothetical protein [Bacillus cereus]EJS44926.1 hypothetical protein ICG_06114 [Bacillus cereus BAG1X1-3]PFW60276.1 hypothetical protein COL27_31590 [Bacillus sp. AFS075960]HDX9655267.1 hypothetical protein [Bacillus wiedmannii]PFD17780.1 hypothetical protein CN263_24810 [Bacillus cereus]PGU49509.1 hypothetical protein COD72_30020 [Bacillus cereus]
MNAKKSFYRTMLEEKKLMHKTFMVKCDGVTHIFNVERMVALIEEAPEEEQVKVKEVFSYLDFRNGDLMHYLHFLAECYVMMNYQTA